MSSHFIFLAPFSLEDKILQLAGLGKFKKFQTPVHTQKGILNLENRDCKLSGKAIDVLRDTESTLLALRAFFFHLSGISRYRVQYFSNSIIIIGKRLINFQYILLIIKEEFYFSERPRNNEKQNDLKKKKEF